jgi:polysaccharide export outer membrane protein
MDAKMGSKLYGFVLALILSLVANLAVAQSEGGTYRIQIEDVLDIRVWEEAQIVAQVTVTQDGFITAPFIGLVKAEGKTTTELEAALSFEYDRQLRIIKPRVSVTLLRPRRILASVLGSVERPGTFEVRPGDKLINLLSLAGNLPFSADLKRARFQRKGWREYVPVDLRAMLLRGDLSQNYEIKDGDILLVPQVDDQNYVRVIGEVREPVIIPYEEEMTLNDAMARTRGGLPTAWQSRIVIIRKKPGVRNEYIRIQADFVKFVKKGDSSQNIFLKPGDTVVVPRNNNPNLGLLSEIANAIFILDRFGITIFNRR